MFFESVWCTDVLKNTLKAFFDVTDRQERLKGWDWVQKRSLQGLKERLLEELTEKRSKVFWEWLWD